ncbi:hypothetical protein PV326_014134 [Microctonus aethiopoides]|nr:hypothetical protein PV326_014134 [Microctonus aethiopoides]
MPTNQWLQYLAALTETLENTKHIHDIVLATLSMAISGSHIGWTSPTLPYLKSNDSHLPTTSNDASWIVSFYLLGSIPGNLIAALMVDRYGRKSTLLFAGLPLLFGWILIIFAWNPYVLYTSRFISGIGQGITYVVCPMYIGEIASKNIRGALGSFVKLMVTLGELYAHTIGPFVDYHYLAYYCAIIPVVFFLSFVWMPESPYYLILKKDQNGAAECLQRLNCYKSKQGLEEVLDQMAKTVMKDMTNRGNFWDIFHSIGIRKAVIISFGLQLILQFSGIAAIESYTQEIMAESDSGLSPGISVIILSNLQLIAGIAAAVLVDKLGRRPLLLSTTFLAALALTTSTIFYVVKLYLGRKMNNFGWILDGSVIVYEFVIALGLSPLPYMMLGELFPTNIKGIAVSLANIWASILAFFVSKMFQVVTDYCGIYTSFGFFAITCFIGIGFIYFVVPETSGKSLLEIQEDFNCHRQKSNQRQTNN